MTEINKIDLLKINAKLQARKNNRIGLSNSAKFEDQLLQTVKKLENMGSEINAMMESNHVQIKSVVKTDPGSKKDISNNVDSVVENFSAVGKTSVKSAKNIAVEYEAMNRKKQS